MVVNAATAGLWFDNNHNGTYSAKFYEGSEYNLQPDGTSGDFLMTDPNGDTLRFYGFESSLPQAQQGTFKSFTDPNGNTISVTSHNTNGQIAEVQRSATTGGVTTTESFLYTYIGRGVNIGLVQNVTLRREVSPNGWKTVRQAVFSYYDGTQLYGNQGDLETEQIEDASNNVLDTSYFRYYLTGQANGFTNGLMDYLSPESYARAAAALGNPLTATDAQLAPYADDYYQYDSQQRVTLATVQGAGATGPGTYTYLYTNSTNTGGYNSWYTRTVETLPDGNTNTVYTNYAGEVMLTDFDDVSDPANPALQGKHWITLDRYDGQGRLIEEAEPSAVTGYSDRYADLMNFVNGTTIYLSNTSGVINLHDYDETATTATSTTPGDVLGYAKDDKVQVGQSGTPVLVDSTQYIAHTANGMTVYPQATSTVYRNTDGTGAETTSDSYTWISGTNEVQSDTTTAPAISAAQNGPGSGTAVFLGTDTTTQGTWIGTYGSDGYNVVGTTTSNPSYPAYATVSASGYSTYTWSPNPTTDTRGLQIPPNGSAGRIASVWYSATSFTIDVNLTDGQAHQLALYAADWDTTGRGETIQITDASSGAVLDTETLSSFHGGAYEMWDVSGHITITITRTSGLNAVLNGLFLDPARPTPTPTPTATFRGTDTTTQGTWIGTYGSDGYNVVGTTTSNPSYPAYATVSASGYSTYTWSPNPTTDTRGLQIPPNGSAGRIASVRTSANLWNLWGQTWFMVFSIENLWGQTWFRTSGVRPGLWFFPLSNLWGHEPLGSDLEPLGSDLVYGFFHCRGLAQTQLVLQLFQTLPYLTPLGQPSGEPAS
jgi:hypothetical protein